MPEKKNRELIDSVIFQELCVGIIKQSSRNKFIDIISKLQLNGAEAIVLGCTEIPLLIKQEHVSIPVFDTMSLHAVTAVERALEA